MGKEYTLSANTLFHFTDHIDKLESILKNNFYPKYCLENWDPVMPKIEGILQEEPREYAMPMVSFCDIPLSQIRKHVGYYGRYAIGLTKEWGIAKNICPVLYTYNNSELSNSIKNIFAKALNQKKREFSITEFQYNINAWIKFNYFVKPYEGYLWRRNKYLDEKIIFYDEREWRFCPDIHISDEKDEEKTPRFLNKESFLEQNKRQNANKMIEKFKLLFEPKNIKYIIVNKEDEIYEMVNKVIQLKKDHNYEDVQVLTTRIISLEHILEDF